MCERIKKKFEEKKNGFEKETCSKGAISQTLTHLPEAFPAPKFIIALKNPPEPTYQHRKVGGLSYAEYETIYVPSELNSNAVTAFECPFNCFQRVVVLKS